MAGAAAADPYTRERGPAMSALRSARGMLLAVVLLAGMPQLVNAQSKPQAIAPEAPVAWSALSPQQQAQLAPVQGEWNQLPPSRQRQLSDNAQRWAALPADEQQQIRDRLQGWASMTPQQRDQLRENMRAFEQMSPQERDQVSQAFEHFQSLPPDQRRALREQWRNADPQQRRQRLRSGQAAQKRRRGH
jgi:hypothetical protein